MDYIAKNLNKFRALPQVIRDAVGSKGAMMTIESLEAEYNIQLGLLVILVTVGELMMEDIEGYLIKKYKLSKEKAEDINLTLQAEIFGPIIEDLENDPILTVFALGVDEKKLALRGVFEKKLITLLKNETEVILITNNLLYSIIQQELVDENKVFEKELSEIVYNNREKIASDPLKIDGKEYPGTVANWIRDFINKNGTGYFSEMQLSEYLVNSKNTKRLEKEEKDLVKNILVLYRNLTYLTESIGESTGQFQIIPIMGDKVTTDTDSQISELSARQLVVSDIKSRLGASDVEFSQYVNSLTDAGDDLDASQITRLIAFAKELGKSMDRLSPAKKMEISPLQDIANDIVSKGAGLGVAYEEDQAFRDRVRNLFTEIDV
jgi:hypothetical protein